MCWLRGYSEHSKLPITTNNLQVAIFLTLEGSLLRVHDTAVCTIAHLGSRCIDCAGDLGKNTMTFYRYRIDRKFWIG